MRSNTFAVEWPPKSGRIQEFPEVDRAEWMPLADAEWRLVKGQVALLGALAQLARVAATSESSCCRRDSVLCARRGSAPMIVARSSSVSSKSKIAKFSTIRSRFTDFGNTMSPRWMCQRSVTWAGVLPRRFGDRHDHRVAEHLALRDGRPCLGRYSVVEVERAHIILRQVGMRLDLVDGRDVVGVDRGGDGCGRAGNWRRRSPAPCRSRTSLPWPPGVDEVADRGHRPVDEEEVEIADVERFERAARTRSWRHRARGRSC